MIKICLQCKTEFRAKEKTQKFCSLKCANNYNKNGLKRVILPKYSIELAEFIGICLGDGYVSNYQTTIELNSIVDEDYVDYVAELMVLLFPQMRITIYKKAFVNMKALQINSKIISDFLLGMGLIPNHKVIPL